MTSAERELNWIVGRNIKWYRVHNKGWSQVEFAKKMGVSEHSVAMIETGRRMYECVNLALAAYILEVEVWQLFYRKTYEEYQSAAKIYFKKLAERCGEPMTWIRKKINYTWHLVCPKCGFVTRNLTHNCENCGQRLVLPERD